MAVLLPMLALGPLPLTVTRAVQAPTYSVIASFQGNSYAGLIADRGKLVRHHLQWRNVRLRLGLRATCNRRPQPAVQLHRRSGRSLPVRGSAVGYGR